MLTFERRTLDDGNRRRFATLLSAAHCSRPLYDQVLYETKGCLLTPTLGSIVPMWLLLIPRIATLNFAQWRNDNALEPLTVIQDVLDHYGFGQDRAIWFEHGPVREGSETACGVDHAHLHVIIDPPFSFHSFAQAVEGAARLNWHKESSARAYDHIGSHSYLLAGDVHTSIYSEKVEAVGSQFFRRVIATLTGLPDEWDYRKFPRLENVRKTLDTMRSIKR
jgi:ATP adenylyltransferase